MKARTQWPNVILGSLGLLTSGYAVYVHNLAKSGKDTGCGFTETISCDKVLTSKWGEFFGIPLGFYGLVFFAVIIIAAIATRETKATPRQFALLNLGLAAIGFCSSLVLLYISLALIKAACPVCLATHTTTTLLFIASLLQYVKSRRFEVKSNGIQPS
jgi:uncharacterized membrane protein